jgi:hypothetical protein
MTEAASPSLTLIRRMCPSSLSSSRALLHEQLVSAQGGLERQGSVLGGDQHHQDGDGDGGDHHWDLIDYADVGYDRVKREDHVEEDYLHQDAAEGRPDPGAFVSLLALKVLVYLEGTLAEQEQAAADQDQVAPGEIKTTLSIPSTISRASSVRKATQISGFSNKSTRPT